MDNDVNHKPRFLTDGEKAIARSIFGDKVDADKVQIKPWGWMNKISPLGARAAGQMLFGDIYVKSENYSADYSKENTARRKLYTHELTHVWQYQARPASLAAEFVELSVKGYVQAYRFPEKLVSEGRANKELTIKFSELNLEQQANIVAGYYENKDKPEAQKIAGRMMKDAGLFLSSTEACQPVVSRLISLDRKHTQQCGH